MNQALTREWQHTRAWGGGGAAGADAPEAFIDTSVGTSRTAPAGACPRCHGFTV